MTARLEHPPTPDALYVASNPEDVEPNRPILTGDVFEDVLIPGVDDSGMAIVITHPCSMRRDGVNLTEKLLMAKVTPYQEVPFDSWEEGHFRVMPLPGLLGQPHAARFLEIGLVPSDLLVATQRLACMSPFGINLLQQRLVWYLTRFAVPTHKLNEVCERVFIEADLLEEWVIESLDRGIDRPTAEQSFHDWIRADWGALGSRQEAIADSQHRATVRREMREELKRIGQTG